MLSACMQITDLVDTYNPLVQQAVHMRCWRYVVTIAPNSMGMVHGQEGISSILGLTLCCWRAVKQAMVLHGSMAMM